MFTVTYNGLVTNHETHLELATRLAACCTFFYADRRDAMRNQGRNPGDSCEVWFTYHAQNWSVVEPGTWIEDHKDMIAFRIKGWSNEGETGREILKLIGGVNEGEHRLTADTISDEQIRALHEEGWRLYAQASRALGFHASKSGDTNYASDDERKTARAFCAQLLNERAKAGA